MSSEKLLNILNKNIKKEKENLNGFHSLNNYKKFLKV